MEEKKRSKIWGIIFILLIIVGVSLFLFFRSDNDRISLIPANWKQFTSRTLGFSIKYPPEVTIKEAYNSVQFAIAGMGWGTKKEYFDGMEFNVTKEEFSDSLDAYVKRDRDLAEKVNESPTPPYPSLINGIEGTSYTSFFGDTSIKKVFLPGKSGNVFYIIRYFHSDPDGRGYGDVIRVMLSTFTLL